MPRLVIIINLIIYYYHTYPPCTPASLSLINAIKTSVIKIIKQNFRIKLSNQHTTLTTIHKLISRLFHSYYNIRYHLI